MSMGKAEAADFQRLKELVESLVRRVEALEAARKPKKQG